MHTEKVQARLVLLNKWEQIAQRKFLTNGSGIKAHYIGSNCEDRE